MVKEEGASLVDSPSEDLIVVRAVRDVDDFVTPDGRPVSMRKEDVATLPEEVASLLIDAGLAERLVGG